MDIHVYIYIYIYIYIYEKKICPFPDTSKKIDVVEKTNPATPLFIVLALMTKIGHFRGARVVPWAVLAQY